MKYTLLLFTLLATACVEPPSTAPVVSVVRPNPLLPGAPTGKLGGVIVTFSGVSSEVLQASAKPISSSQNLPTQNLSAQDLSSASGLSFTNINQNSFTQGSRTNGTGFRYLTATFRVTPAIELQNLSFVAQVKAGSTLFDTAVLGLKKFDGSSYSATDAQTIARAVRPVHAPLPSGSSLLVNANNTDFQVWTEAELGSYTPASGSYLLPYGFVARSETGGRVLDGTTPGVVTFALKLPLRASSKDDPFSFSMYFEAVTDTQTRVTQSLEESDGGAGAAFRAKQAGAKTVVNLLPGGVYSQVGPTRTLCDVRIAGPADNVLERLFPPGFRLVSKSPSPNSESVPQTATFGQTFSAPPSNIGANTLQLISSFRGFLPASYSTVGSSVTVTPSGALLPGEEVTLNATRGLNLCPPSGNAFRVRASAGGVGVLGRQQVFATMPPGSTRDRPAGMTLGDLNNDGKLDAVVANANSGSVSVLLGNGGGGLAVSGNTRGGPANSVVALGDLNNDGKLDVVTGTQNFVFVLLGDGRGGLGERTDLSVRFATSIALGDPNGDGKLDILASNFGSNTVSVLLGDGNGSFGAATDFPVGLDPIGLALGDFNNDGKLDAMTANFGLNNVSVLLGNDGGVFGTATNFAVGTRPRFVALGDLNNDGKLDAMTANGDSNDVSVLLGNGRGGFAAATDFAVGIGPRSVALGDLNGDGKLDAAVANATSENVSLLFGNGGGGFGPATNSPDSATPVSSRWAT